MWKVFDRFLSLFSHCWRYRRQGGQRKERNLFLFSPVALSLPPNYFDLIAGFQVRRIESRMLCYAYWSCLPTRWWRRSGGAEYGDHSPSLDRFVAISSCCYCYYSFDVGGVVLADDRTSCGGECHRGDDDLQRKIAFVWIIDGRENKVCVMRLIRITSCSSAIRLQLIKIK